MSQGVALYGQNCTKYVTKYLCFYTECSKSTDRGKYKMIPRRAITPSRPSADKDTFRVSLFLYSKGEQK